MLVPPWAYAAGAAVALAVSFGAGWQVRAWKAGNDQLKQVSATQDAIDAQRRAWDRAAGWLEGARAELDSQSYSTRTIIRETYQNVEVPSDCAAPDAVADGLRASVESANRAAAGLDPVAVR